MLHNVRQQQKREEKRIRQAEKALKSRSLGVYLHIPFCRSKCAYCDFYSLPASDQRMDAYLEALCAHITESAPYLRGFTIDSVYIGGGTPSFWGEKRLKKLLKTVNKELSPAKDCEYTLECNPDSVSLKLLKTVRALGVNRISLGVQSARDGELQTVGRPHTFAQAREAVALIRRAKVDNLNLDLIYGLPGQTMESWQESVEAVLALKPEHLSLYGLQVEKGTPLYRCRDSLDLADDDAQADRYLWAVNRLAQAGYDQYEISNFARPGRESRHNLKYWTMQEYVGFGPGAHSDFGGRRYSFLRDVNAYIEGVLQGGQLLDQDDQIPPRERSAEYLMLGMRTVRGISGQEYRNTYRMHFAPVEERLRAFAARGWAVEEGGRWHFTPEGFLLSNQLIGLLLEAGEEATLEQVLGKQ
ncbi:MAG: radical SAM family heme chaperone HemW [Clostridiales bacterium]|nr:radical SAM family heme chaperone HemW [Clostridiales bacterium]